MYCLFMLRKKYFFVVLGIFASQTLTANTEYFQTKTLWAADVAVPSGMPQKFGMRQAQRQEIARHLLSYSNACPDQSSTLNLTNEYRSLHGAAPLAWNDSLALSAQATASNLAANQCGRHQQGGPSTYVRSLP